MQEIQARDANSAIVKYCKLERCKKGPENKGRNGGSEWWKTQCAECIQRTKWKETPRNGTDNAVDGDERRNCAVNRSCLPNHESWKEKIPNATRVMRLRKETHMKRFIFPGLLAAGLLGAERALGTGREHKGVGSPGQIQNCCQQ